MPQRLPGLKDSAIPCPYFCTHCNTAVDAAYTHTNSGMVVFHNRCKSPVVTNPDYATWKAAQTDDFADLLED